jgi:hypothetical protein
MKGSFTPSAPETRLAGLSASLARRPRGERLDDLAIRDSAVTETSDHPIEFITK